jgi:hypothetical protein
MAQKTAYLGPFPAYNHLCDDTSRQRDIGFADNVLASCDLNACVDGEYPLVNSKQAFQNPLTRRYPQGKLVIKTGIK